MATIRLLICDVDGTLLTSEKKLSSATVAAAKRLRLAGIKLALTSGRPPLGMKMLPGPLELDSPLACFNGGVFVRPDLTPLETHAIAPEVASRVIRALIDTGVDVWVYTERDWLIRDMQKPRVAREQWTVKFLPLIVPNFDHVKGSMVKIVGVGEDHDGLEKYEKKILTEFGESVSASRSQPYYLDVTSPRANKGEVVDYYARLYGLSHEAIAAIGDGNNDTQMFLKAGLGIAVDNANDYVKSRASVTVASNDEDGFAEAVDRYILNRKKAA